MPTPPFETPLCELAYRYGSDKCPQIKHPFTPFYYELFAPIRDRVRKVLEIGVGDADEMRWTGVPDYQTGASLRMWRDFFPLAQVYGADIKPSAMFQGDRIETFQCDQASAGSLWHLLDRTCTDLDIVIDDGSHIPAHQVFTCNYLMPLLKRDVLYIIEDVGHPEIMEQLQGYHCHAVRRSRQRYKDDRLVVVRHPSNGAG